MRIIEPLASFFCQCVLTDNRLGSFPLGQNNAHAHVEMGSFLHAVEDEMVLLFT